MDYDGRYKEISINEIACRCGCGFKKMPMELVEMFMVARRLFGEGITINSGCRCQKHNDANGGKGGSAHVLGMALDIKPAKMTGNRNTDMYKFILLGNLLGRAGFERVGIRCNNDNIGTWFYHVDINYDKGRNIFFPY